jgi:hypothetical protein
MNVQAPSLLFSPFVTPASASPARAGSVSDALHATVSVEIVDARQYDFTSAALSAAWLWLLENVALAFVSLSILILFVGSGNKLVALAGIVFFRFAATKFALMLFLRRRRSTTEP